MTSVFTVLHSAVKDMAFYSPPCVKECGRHRLTGGFFTNSPQSLPYGKSSSLQRELFAKQFAGI